MNPRLGVRVACAGAEFGAGINPGMKVAWGSMRSAEAVLGTGETLNRIKQTRHGELFIEGHEDRVDIYLLLLPCFWVARRGGDSSTC